MIVFGEINVRRNVGGVMVWLDPKPGLLPTWGLTCSVCVCIGFYWDFLRNTAVEGLKPLYV